MTKQNLGAHKPLFVTIGALDGLIVAQMRHNTIEKTQEYTSIPTMARNCANLQIWHDANVPIFDLRPDGALQAISQLSYDYACYKITTSEFIAACQSVGIPQYHPNEA